ncbi:MAG: sulfotransferase [Actinomycetota bacterium]|jgi:hypothetical protein|nr:sulfotransferase [Actinomycetota bacterium]
MPIFRNQQVIEVARGIKAFLNLSAGVTRGKVPSLDANSASSGGQADGPMAEQLKRMRNELAWKEEENSRLRSRLNSSEEFKGISPERIIWITGSGRSGSSWLTAMMADLKSHSRWNEPHLGSLFGNLYYLHSGERNRSRDDFVLGERYKESWINAVRRFILEAANVRFPELSEAGHLVVKEPNGAIGTPIVMDALPESRLVLLIRDPRDVASSALMAQKKGSWGNEWKADGNKNESLADTDPDKFVWHWANAAYLPGVQRAKEAFERHKAPKSVIRYEDLRYDTLETMRRLYRDLEVRVDEGQLRKAVEKHAWENIPEEKKGENKTQRKAKPGGWREDLAPAQIRVVEQVAGSIIDEFYPSQ